MNLERVWYETRPFLFFVGGFIALIKSGGSWLLMISGVLLLISSGYTLKARIDYRDKGKK